MRTVFKLSRQQQQKVDKAMKSRRTCSLCKKRFVGLPKYLALQPVSSKSRDPLIRAWKGGNCVLQVFCGECGWQLASRAGELIKAGPQ